MAKFKVGDKVRIRKDIKEGHNKHNLYINDEMEHMAGKVVTISGVYRCWSMMNKKGVGYRYYRLKEDVSNWNWWKHTLEPYYEHGVVGKTFTDLPSGPQYGHYDTWFTLESTPKKLQKKAVLFKNGDLIVPGIYKCIGIAPHGSDDRLVACLMNLVTQQVYLYTARKLPGYEE